MSTQAVVSWLRDEWWWRVTRHFEPDNLRWRIAFLIPRKVALFVFIRVYAASTDGILPCGCYERCYDGWQNGAGK